MKRLLFVVSEDWYFVSHRLHLALAARAAGYQVALLTHVSVHRERIEAAGVELIDWKLDRKSRNPVAELRSLWEVWRAIRRYRPHVVHAVALKPVLYAALACRPARVKGRVYAMAGLGFVFSSRKLLARTLRPMLIAALRWTLGAGNSRLIVQNPDDMAVLMAAKVVDKKRVRMIRGSGVDTDEFLPRARPDDPPLVVLPARLLWDKGVGEFVSMARQLRSEGSAARFALVGEPDEHNPECVSPAQVDVWIAEGVVEAWGRRTDMPAVLNRAAIICLPSYREGLPKALLEAASCARPIVTFDVPGCREVVEDGENGYLVPFGDVHGLCRAVGRLLEDREARECMGDCGRQRVLREFSQERVAAETLELWHEVT